MRRRASEEDAAARAWRKGAGAHPRLARHCPDLAIRSTFIVGFPGETDDEFEMLLDWIDEAGIDRAGCFKYEPVKARAPTSWARAGAAGGQGSALAPLHAASADGLGQPPAEEGRRRLPVIVDEAHGNAAKGARKRRARDRRRSCTSSRAGRAGRLDRYGQDRPVGRVRSLREARAQSSGWHWPISTRRSGARLPPARTLSRLT